jgi:hypothetical protein
LWRLTDKLSMATNYPRFKANLLKQLERNESEEWPRTAPIRALLSTYRYELLMSFLLKCLSSISEVMTLLTKILSTLSRKVVLLVDVSDVQWVS